MANAVSAVADEDLAIISSVAQTARLLNIQLREIEAKAYVSNDELLSEESKTTIDFSTKTSFKLLDAAPEEHRPLDIRATCELVFTAPDETPRLRITLVYLIQYHITGPATHGDRAYQLFSDVNAVHNVWPYFREMVHTTMCHMGLPPYTLPLRKVGGPKKGDSKKVTPATGNGTATVAPTTPAPPTQTAEPERTASEPKVTKKGKKKHQS